ncbi:thioredoxin-dependent thiol peroxidase [Arachidicoccus terrestris]|uniref:thioredoxin-dependent thiol peroxidase n=1 Tax=Arachidicoccus terrestris TaxID=2875539 RepID=UPI001CC4467C|nr:thioredoxin-dependent thiol peroxidase [Arachidicoccus terrestris]UAY54828.1 thioredoxin-dependent thiol peroxidase [Arachidicoccus terrestris]
MSDIILKPGDKAPAFKGVDQNGDVISLADFKGQRVVLYFYPKDNTPGCTAQACNLRDNYQTLIKQGYQVIGVSGDSVKSHKKFEEKFDLPFPLIADEDKVILDAYGVYGPKKFMGRSFLGIHRTTFLIDEKSIIRAIITKPDTKNQTQQILDTWSTLGG